MAILLCRLPVSVKRKAALFRLPFARRRRGLRSSLPRFFAFRLLGAQGASFIFAALFRLPFAWRIRGFVLFFLLEVRKPKELSLLRLSSSFEKAGTYLSSQVVSNQVFSAQSSLTSVFGMGTGGSSTSSAPAIYAYPVSGLKPSLRSSLFSFLSRMYLQN